MTTHPSSAPVAATNTHPPQHALADQLAAHTLFLQQLVFLLDTTGALRADALDRWLTTSRQAMLRTGSVNPAQVAALAALQQDVMR